MNDHYHSAGGTPFSTYSPSSLFVTSSNRAGYSLDTEYTLFHITPSSFGYSIYSNKITCGFFLGPETSSVYSLLTAATTVTGRFNPPPSWSWKNGATVGMQGGTDKVKSKLAKLASGGVPIAGLWIQDWAGKRIDSFGSRILWNWELDSKFYPSWGQMLANLKAEGIKVLTYVNPYLATRVREFKPHHTRDLFEEAKQRKFLVTHADGTPYIQSSASDSFQFGTVDFTNMRASAWFKDVIVKCNMLCDCDDAHVFWPVIARNPEEQAHDCGNGLTAEEGVATAQGGWMADFGEYLPYDVKLKDGSSGMEMHNAFPTLWAQTVSDAVGPNSDTLFFSRAGGLTSPRAGVNGGQFWAGDQNTQFDPNDGLLSALTSYITGGLSGFTMIHSDIGGYTSLDIDFPTEPESTHIVVERTEELLLRWMEMSAVADCMFRSHEGNQADKQLQVWSNPTLVAAFAYWANFHAALAELRGKLFEEAKESGWPVVRGMWFDHGMEGWGKRDQYMFGTYMLVAPIVEEGMVKRDVWMPKGTWVNFWTCEVVNLNEAETREVGAPIGKPPMFVREGALEEMRHLWAKLGMDVCGV
jgi:alpha-glucosidase